MKAQDLTKKPITIEEIYQRISDANKLGDFKIFIAHFTYFTDDVKVKLMNDGYKVYKGSWDGMINDCFIIEW